MMSDPIEPWDWSALRGRIRGRAGPLSDEDLAGIWRRRTRLRERMREAYGPGVPSGRGPAAGRDAEGAGPAPGVGQERHAGSIR